MIKLYIRARESSLGQTMTEYMLTAALIAVVVYSLYRTLTRSA
jgi:Flp pilus assembly pilin Flp